MTIVLYVLLVVLVTPTGQVITSSHHVVECPSDAEVVVPLQKLQADGRIKGWSANCVRSDVVTNDKES